MNRSAVPRIAPTDLRDHADEARVARIWDRIEHDLTGFEAPPSRSFRLAYLAVAAAFAAFGGGIFVGKLAFQERTSPAVAVVASSDKTAVDVLAAGSEGRTYTLPGGGMLALEPGATVELEHIGSAVTLKLVQGEASVDTASARYARGLVIVAGAARLDTQAGSVFNVRRNQDDMDISVRDGSVDITSPLGSRKLGRGESEAVPIHMHTAVASPNDAPLSPRARSAVRAHRPDEPQATPPPAAQGNVPEWITMVNTGDSSGALGLLRQAPGGIDGAIASAQSALELMAISDAARSKGGDPRAAISALKSLVERFPADPNAPIAAYYLSKMYNAKGQPDLAKRYQDLYPTAEVAQDALCGQMRAEQEAGHKDEARRKAEEYVAKYPDGPCKDNAESVLQNSEAASAGEAVHISDGGVSGKAPVAAEGGAL
jgi:TolA-binding protein